MAAKQSDIEQIFNTAAEIEDAGERAAYLDNVCDGNERLRVAIDALLEHDRAADSLLDKSAPGLGATLAQAITEQPGTVIGRYKLKEQIGEGGMGVVYVAEQTEPVRRKVALKIIKPGMDTRQVIARFEAERQALALMDHPNIARVLDAGATESGRPYFVMELVRGMPITDFCDKAKLTTDGRLGLFSKVCQAVQHAHQKGIIHRDIKPSNVMVTLHDGVPIPKVIDFGVAKASGQQLTEQSVYTQLTEMIGTPLYMSPEQAELSALDVDTRSDVYSLGVLLYELLTGTTPFDRATLREAGFDEIRRIIREQEPPKPSDRLGTVEAASLSTISEQRGIDPRKLTHTLCGDLDRIVMKALEKDRTRRYETASALAADVSRYLADEPIEACPPSQIYRFRKFARRNKTLLGAGTAVALALLVGAGISSWQAYRATKAESEARQQQGRAEENLRLALEAVDQIYLEFVDERSPTFGVDGADRQKPITPEGEKFLRKAMEFYEKFAWANQHDPLVRHETAKAYFKVATIHERINMLRQAVAVFSQSIRIAEQLVAEFPKVTEYQETLWQAHHQRGWNYIRIGKYDEPIADFSEALKWAPDSAATYCCRGAVYHMQKEHDLALQDLNKALTLEPDLVNAYNNRGLVYASQKKYDLALANINKSLKLEPDNANTYYCRGAVYRKQKEYDLALADYNNALELKPDYADAYNDRGNVYRKQKEYDLALADFNKARELDADCAFAHNNRGVVYYEQRIYDLALADFNKALELDADNASAYSNRGGVYCKQREYDLALQDFNRALKLEHDYVSAYKGRGDVYCAQKEHELALADYNRALKLEHDYVSAYNGRGHVYCVQKEYELALADYNRALELEPDLAAAYNNRGLVYLEQEEYDPALADCNKALELDAGLVHAYQNRGAIYYEQKEYELALADFNKALELAPDDAVLYNNRGNVYRKQKEYDLALADFNRTLALADYNKELDADLAHTHHRRASLYCMQKQYERALADWRKALELEPDSPNWRHNLALFLLNCPDPQFRDTARALELAKEAVKASPKDAAASSVLGQAHYRGGDYQGAVEALEEASELGYERKARNWFFLAMAHSKLGHKEQAHEVYQQAAAWMAKNQSPGAAFPISQFRAEAVEVLGIEGE